MTGIINISVNLYVPRIRYTDSVKLYVVMKGVHY